MGSDNLDTVQQIKQLLSDSNDNEPMSVADQDVGEPVQEQALRGNDSGSSALDYEESDTPESLEDDTEEGQIEAFDSEPITVKTLAEKLGVEPADLYDELEIPIADGERVTLGQLKDWGKQYGEPVKLKQQVEDQKAEYERSVLATRAHLNAMMSVASTPQERELVQRMVQAGAAHQEGYTKEQETMVLEAIPEWQDADNRSKDRDAIIAIGAQYGFSEPEMTHTQDARTLKMLRDFTRLQQRVKDMESMSKRAPGKPNQPNGKGVRTTAKQKRLAAALSRASQTGDPNDKRQAVQMLIAGNN